MCGIAGYVTLAEQDSGETSGSPVLARMTGRIAHRGPDGSGEWTGGKERWRVRLGHRRLSIIDLEGGKQPLGDERLQITFNGEIYNFQELRRTLESHGHRFGTRSDTEVLLRQFGEKGVAGLPELNGMFAFAIWDQRDGSLTLARDRAGIKPLYYARLPSGGIAFASELTALLEHPGVGRRLSPEAVAEYFFRDYVLSPRSLIDSVRKLEPGHSITWKNGELSQPVPFWELSRVSPASATTNEEELVQELRERLTAAVRRQMIADVPVGVFLSGGIDSSTVAALAQKLTREPLFTFSIGFEDPTYDESEFAREVAVAIGSRHVEETLSEDRLIGTVDQALSALDEPVADPSMVPTYLLSALAARHVKVALGGDGGDELWAGYPTYRAHRLGQSYQAIPGIVRRSIIEPMVDMLPINDRYQSFEWKAKRFTQRWDDRQAVRHLRWMSNTDLSDLSRAMRSEKAARLDPLGGWREPAWPESKDDLNRMLALDFQTYLPGSVLAKVDRASMAHGLETRPPFLDNELIDFAFSLPSRLKLRGKDGKHLLKRAVTGLIPERTIHRPKKGFGIPLARWLRGPMRPLLDRTLKDSPLWDSVLDRGAFAGWIVEHQEGRRDRAKTLWALIALDHWTRKGNFHA